MRDEYGAETAGGIMVQKVPTARRTDPVHSVLDRIAKESWDDIHSIYIVSPDDGLLGVVPIHTLLASSKTQKVEKIMVPVKFSVTPEKDQERVVIEAIRNDVRFVPVVDKNNHFLGAITDDQIVDVLHEEHLEDSLRSSGIRGKGSQILELFDASFKHIILARLPWLIVGLGVGLAASLIISQFEDFLDKNVALAFFISMIAYMSDAIGTQSETIFIRSITVLNFNKFTYIVRELLVGVVLGALMGFFAGVAAFVISHSMGIALAVGVSLLLSMSVATVLACITPLVLKAFGKDPAIGSGPFTTALQDLISITIYFLIALFILGR
jgi:magnesium transporter